MYKTMGGGSWSGLWAATDSISVEESQANPPPIPKTDDVVEEFSLAWQSLKQVTFKLQYFDHAGSDHCFAHVVRPSTFQNKTNFNRKQCSLLARLCVSQFGQLY